MEIRFIDLFCGIGGFRLGLERANKEEGVLRQSDLHRCIPSLNECRESNWETPSRNWGKKPHSYFTCVWSNDNDKYACQVYRKHFGSGEFYEGDIRAVDANAIPEHDLLCAGFPCQSFSIAGKRKGFEDTRGTLFFEICRVLRAKRPSYLLLENVKGLLSTDNGATFLTILQSLDDLGYDCQWQVLNSKDYGVPQNRERVFIIGHTRGKPRPKVFPIGETNAIYSESDGQISHAIDSNYHKGWLDHGQRTMVIQTGHRAKGKPRFYEDEIPAMTQDYGTGGQNVPLIANAVDVDGYLRFGARPRDENGKPQLLPIGYRRIRRLTPLECERLQGFPDKWIEKGMDKDGSEVGISDTQRYKVLGNAVTVNVIEAIGRQIVMELKI